jgi:SAM-dependent methyltransferase
MKQTTICPICKLSNNLKQWTSQPDKLNSSIECVICDVVFAKYMLDDNDFNNFYNNYNDNRDSEKKDLAIKRNLCYKQDITFINKNCINKFKNILDIGCGNGEFLSLFDGYKKTGYDIDRHIIINNKSNYPDINFISDLNEINNDQLFDLIIFRGTFQYMRDLNYIIDFIENKLDKNGYLIILSLPNKNSPLAQIQRENWSLYNPIEMFNIFSLTSIKKLFNNYKIINTEFPYLETPYADEKNDMIKFNELILNNKQSKFPFWGSMMQIIFQK